MDYKKDMIDELSLEQKAKLFVGKNEWQTEPIQGKCLFLSDGPHGIRKEEVTEGKKSTVEAVCYPAACLSACSFDKELFREYGEELAKEAIAHDVDVLLGPGTNIKRNPLCGRNFEYFSEDPYLSGKLAAAYIKGVQSKNVGTSLKHFAMNSQEYARFINDSQVDDRAMREIYLKAFEIAIGESDPWTVMASYNVVNGIHATENKQLLTDILRDEFGFRGVVMSDWGAIHHPVESLKAGLNLEMPGLSKGSEYRICQAVQNETLEQSVLDASTMRLAELYQKCQQPKADEFDREHALEMAKRIGDESIVLLKNRDNLLPLNKNQKIALIGDFCVHPRFQGGGSSQINPLYVSNLLDVLREDGISLEFARGYDSDNLKPSKALIRQAKRAAAGKDAVVIMCGLPRALESEGYDREHMQMPASHLELIRQVAAVNRNVIVVLQNGAPVEMPFLPRVKAVVEAYLGGSMHAQSIRDVLYGIVNPSGRLAETFPISYGDVPSADTYLKDMYESPYRESIYVGYRYYDTFHKNVLFPFGYGLSYSEIRYSELKAELREDRAVLTFRLTNSSQRPAKEVVQIYAGLMDDDMMRARKELKAFDKIPLEAGETKTVTMEIPVETLRYYSANQNSWKLRGGKYRFYLAKDALDESLYADLEIASPDAREVMNVPKIYFKMNRPVTDQEFRKLLGRNPSRPHRIRPYTIESPICEFRKSVLGFIVFGLTTAVLVLSAADKYDRKMFRKAIPTQPIRSIQMMAPVSKTNIEGIVDIFNRHPIRGFRKLFSKEKVL